MALNVDITTACGVASDSKVGIMAVLSFQYNIKQTMVKEIKYQYLNSFAPGRFE